MQLPSQHLAITNNPNRERRKTMKVTEIHEGLSPLLTVVANITLVIAMIALLTVIVGFIVAIISSYKESRRKTVRLPNGNAQIEETPTPIDSVVCLTDPKHLVLWQAYKGTKTIDHCFYAQGSDGKWYLRLSNGRTAVTTSEEALKSALETAKTYEELKTQLEALPE